MKSLIMRKFWHSEADIFYVRDIWLTSISADRQFISLSTYLAVFGGCTSFCFKLHTSKHYTHNHVIPTWIGATLATSVQGAIQINWCTSVQPPTGIFLSGGLAPLNLDNPKRSKIWYVVCSTIIRHVAAAAKCESSAIDFWMFLNLFWMFCEISGPLSHAAYTERSTIVDLLIKIPGPLNPAAYWKVHNFFKRSKICPKKTSKISNAPLGKSLIW